MNEDARIFVAGHRGLAGSAIVRKLAAEGCRRILMRTRQELDLRDQLATFAFFEAQRPEYVFLAAAKVGGIAANDAYPADFIADNLAIQLNVIRAAHRTGVRKLLFLGSSCIYPRDCPQPIKEDDLLSGKLERTNEWYAIAKIAGIKLCHAFNRQHGTDYITLMPTNLYGPGDNYDPETSHVLPALIRRMHEAKVQGRQEVVIWGTGTPRREFLYSDDLADACLFAMQRGVPGLTNVGAGKDLSIRELAELVAGIVGFGGQLRFDPRRPDGTPRKVLDVSKLAALGWRAKVGLAEGIALVYQDFLAGAERAA